MSIVCTEELMGPGFFMFFQTEECRPVSDGGVVWKKGDFHKKFEPAKHYELTSNIIIRLLGGNACWYPAEDPKLLSSLHIANMILWPQSQNSFSKQETAKPVIALRLNADFATTDTKGATKYQYSSNQKLTLKADIASLYFKNVVDVKNVASVSEPETPAIKVDEPETRTVELDIQIQAIIQSDIWFENGVGNVEESTGNIAIIRSAPVNMRILFDVESQFTPDYTTEYNEDEELLTMFAMVLQKMDEY